MQPGLVLVLVVGGTARATPATTSASTATPTGTRGATSGRGCLRRDPHQIALGLANHDEGMFARWDVMLKREQEEEGLASNSRH